MYDINRDFYKRDYMPHERFAMFFVGYNNVGREGSTTGFGDLDKILVGLSAAVESSARRICQHLATRNAVGERLIELFEAVPCFASTFNFNNGKSLQVAVPRVRILLL